MTRCFLLARRIAVLVAAVVSASSIAQQMTVSDLLGKGAKVLSRTEVLMTLSDTHMSGTQVNSQTAFDSFYSAEGLVKGQVTLGNGVKVGVKGEWTVDDNGNCIANMISSQGARWTARQVFLKLESDIYAAEDKGPRQPVTRRQFRRN